jgi:hypothetical protein
MTRSFSFPPGCWTASRLSRKILVKQTFEACGGEFDKHQIDVLCHKFIHGKGIADLKKRAAPTSQ